MMFAPKVNRIRYVTVFLIEAFGIRNERRFLSSGRWREFCVGRSISVKGKGRWGPSRTKSRLRMKSLASRRWRNFNVLDVFRPLSFPSWFLQRRGTFNFLNMDLVFLILGSFLVLGRLVLN